MKPKWIVLIVVLFLGGCAVIDQDADRYLGRDASGDTPVLERGSYEDAKTRLDAMMAQMSAELTEAFPDCPMQPDPERGEKVSGGGPIEEEYEEITPYVAHSRYRLMECTISDTHKRANTAITIVATIAKQYGFQPHITYNDRIKPNGEGYVAIEGWNADGDSYSFSSGKRSTLRYGTAPRFTAEQLESIRTNPEATPPTPPWSYFKQLDQESYARETATNGTETGTPKTGTAPSS